MSVGVLKTWAYNDQEGGETLGGGGGGKCLLVLFVLIMHSLM